MEFNCVECQTATKAELPFEPQVFVCPKCRQSYVWSPEGFRLSGQWNPKFRNTKIPVGTKAKLRGRELTVTGSVTKEVHRRFYWEEYTLCDKEGNFFYLSESDGNFILLEETNISGRLAESVEVPFEGTYYRLYERTMAHIHDAQGFFDEKLPNERIQTADYIAPPRIFSIESVKKDRRFYKGEHISRKEIKKAFPNFKMPYKSGLGIVQPFPIDFWNLVIVMGAMGFLMCLVHFVVYFKQQEQTVLYESLRFSDYYDGKQYTSPSFELAGGSAPLTIEVSAAVDNSWANLGVSLVNESTNDEIEASKDIEYYHGYTDGETWREGSQSDSFNICGVGAGKYHLVLMPTKDSLDSSASDIHVKAVWNQPSTRNVGMTLLFAAIFCLIIYGIRYQFEKKRWSESDYSEYE